MSNIKTRKMKAGDRYYYIIVSDFTVGSSIWLGNDFQLAKLGVGNIFLSFEEANRKRERILEILKEDWE